MFNFFEKEVNSNLMLNLFQEIKNGMFTILKKSIT